MTRASPQAEQTRTLPTQNLRPTRARHLQRLGPLRIASCLVNLFAKFDRRRDPPGPHKTQHARLITIKVSHYCEKARWALDLAEADPDSRIYYTEDPHPPALSSFAVVPASLDNGSITPLVLLDEHMHCVSGRGDAPTTRLAESYLVLRHFCPQLYPSPIAKQVKAMEDMLGERLGPTVRVYCYQHFMSHNPDALIRVCSGDTTKVEELLFSKMFYKGIQPGMRKLMSLSEEAASDSQSEIRRVFKEVSELLDQNGDGYILDDDKASYGFTAADLSLAALAAPILRPPELASFSCSDSELPSIVTEFANELKNTSAGKHVLKIYAKHRPVDSENKVVAVKGVDRNRVPWAETSIVLSLGVAISSWIYQSMV